MRKSDRLFQLVNLVRIHQPITAEVLAERIGVSVRTIYRYIDDLSLSGIPLYGTTGIGYALDEGFELPPLTLNADERDALVLGVEMLGTCAGAELGAAARSLLVKILAALPASAREPSLANVRALRVRPADEEQRNLDTLRRLIQQGRAVQFAYLSLAGEASQRTVFPLGLFYWGGKWTVGSWCTQRRAYRDFRVERMHSLQAQPEGLELQGQFNLQAYMQFQAAQWAVRGH